MHFLPSFRPSAALRSWQPRCFLHISYQLEHGMHLLPISKQTYHPKLLALPSGCKCCTCHQIFWLSNLTRQKQAAPNQPMALLFLHHDGCRQVDQYHQISRWLDSARQSKLFQEALCLQAAGLRRGCCSRYQTFICLTDKTDER